MDFRNVDNQLDNDKLVVGFLAKLKASQLLEEGDISASKFSSFFCAVREFFMHAIEYLLKWCPLKEELLKHATWIDFENRLDKGFCSVDYFIHRFPNIFQSVDMDKLNEQFLNYQLLMPGDIPAFIREKAEENDHYRIDDLWGYLKGVKKPGTNISEFDQLFKVAEVVLSIPHSNASEERVFSFINKNKTPARDSLKLDGTLSSLMIVKTHIDNPLKWKPSESILQNAKKATYTYNAEHKN